MSETIEKLKQIPMIKKSLPPRTRKLARQLSALRDMQDYIIALIQEHDPEWSLEKQPEYPKVNPITHTLPKRMEQT